MRASCVTSPSLPSPIYPSLLLNSSLRARTCPGEPRHDQALLQGYGHLRRGRCGHRRRWLRWPVLRLRAQQDRPRDQGEARATLSIGDLSNHIVRNYPPSAQPCLLIQPQRICLLCNLPVVTAPVTAPDHTHLPALTHSLAVCPADRHHRAERCPRRRRLARWPAVLRHGGAQARQQDP